MKPISWLMELLFPSRCIGCGRPEPEGLCACCRERFLRIGKDVCPRCGRDDALCICKDDIYRRFIPRGYPQYQQLTAPYYYDERMKKCIDLFKFHGQKIHARWMGREMARKIREQMNIELLDGIVPVPLYHDRLRERGYNQAELLAQEISRELSLPVLSVLVKVRDNVQHMLNRQQRWKNAIGGYEATEEVVGLRLLLIDDISTTGATLNGCGQALYRMGANAVVCCTLALTRWELPDPDDENEYRHMMKSSR